MPVLPRLFLAWIISIVLLPYFWARLYVFNTMMVGRYELRYVGLAALTLVALALLLGKLSSKDWPFSPPLLYGAVMGGWLLANATLIFLYNGPLLPTWIVLPLFLFASYWVVWMIWFRFWPGGFGIRLGVLLVGLGGAVLFPLLVRTAGLTGDSRLNFVWRGPAGQALTNPAGEIAKVDVTRIGPHDFPQYLGPERSAVVPAVAMARDWREKPPRERWRHAVGLGWGGFAIVGEAAITQEQRGDRECVVCYRLSDGTPLWEHSDVTRFVSGMGGDGPRATPTIADGKVYTVGATGLLHCLDGATGKPIWTKKVLEDFGGQNLAHGVCGSPLIVGDLVVVSPPGEGGPSLVAYQRVTGELVWKGGNARTSYSSPHRAEILGQEQVLLHHSEGVTAHEPKTGRELWSFPFTNQEHVNCSQPIVNGAKSGQILLTTGYGTGAVMIQVAQNTGGDWSAKELWRRRVLQTKFTTAVVHREHAYGLDEGILACVDLATGKRVWKDGRYQHGQILLAGDLLLIQAENGAVVLVEPSPAGLQERGRYPALSDKTWNTLALAGRLLLARNDREAVCLELPE